MVALTRAIEDDISPEQVRINLDRKLDDMRAKLLRRRALAEGEEKQSTPDNDE